MENNLQFLHTDDILQAICQLIRMQSSSDHALFQSTMTEDQIEHLFHQLILSENSEPFFSLIQSDNIDIAKYGSFKTLELLNPFHPLVDIAIQRLQTIKELSSLEYGIVNSLKHDIAEARLHLIMDKKGTFITD